MKQVMKILLVLLGVMLGFAEPVFGQDYPIEQIYVEPGGIVEYEKISASGSFHNSSIQSVNGRKKDGVLYWIKAKEKIIKIDARENPNVILQNGMIGIKSKGFFIVSAVVESNTTSGTRYFKEARVFCTNYKAEFLYGEQSEVDIGKSNTNNKDFVSPDVITITKPDDLTKVIGVPKGLYSDVWWDLEVDGKKISDVFGNRTSLSLEEILNTVKARFPNYDKKFTLLAEFSDGLDNTYKKKVLSASFDTIRIVDKRTPPPPTVWNVRIEPLQNGSITASPDKASAGTSVELRINPAQNYRLKEGTLSVRSTSGQSIPVSNNRFVMPESEVRVSAQFEPIPPTVWNVRIEPLQNGSITASPDKASAGTSVELRINPAQNYRLKEGSLVVRSTSGQSIPVSNNRFVMPESEVRVSAQFEEIPKPKYQVNFSHSGQGSISASVDGNPIQSGALVEQGKSVIFTANPANNWRIKNWNVQNSNNSTYTINSLQSAVDVQVVFEEIPKPKHQVNFSHSGQGSISASVDGQAIQSGTLVEQGKSVTFTANPANNWRIKNWNVQNSNNSTYIINSLQSAVDIQVVFEEIPAPPPTPKHQVNFSHSGQGSISASVDGNPIQSGALVEQGKKVIFTANPANNWRIKNWNVQNSNNSTYTINSLQSAVDVQVVFEGIPPTNVPITALSLGREAIKLKAGSEHQLQLTITPANTTDSKVFTWKSSNPAVVEVVDGKLIAKELGLSTISVEAQNGVKAELLVVIDQSRDDEQFKLPHILGLKDRNDGAVMQLENQNFQFFWADAQEVQKFAFLCERNDGKTERFTFERGMDQTLKLDAGQWKLTITLDAGTANEQIVTYPVIIAEQEKR